jgi:hypothetical protein
MIGTVVTFWRFPEEEEDFIRRLESSGPVTAVAAGWERDPSSLTTPLPVRELIARDPSEVLLSLPEFMRELPISAKETESGTLYFVRWWEAPALSYSRGAWRAPNRLGACNMWADWHVRLPDGGRPDEFVKWGKKIFAWLRNQTPEWHQYKTYRITGKVADAIKSGLEIVP